MDFSFCPYFDRAPSSPSSFHLINVVTADIGSSILWFPVNCYCLSFYVIARAQLHGAPRVCNVSWTFNQSLFPTDFLLISFRMICVSKFIPDFLSRVYCQPRKMSYVTLSLLCIFLSPFKGCSGVHVQLPSEFEVRLNMVHLHVLRQGSTRFSWSTLPVCVWRPNPYRIF